MQMLQWAKVNGPKFKLSLHAGEPVPGLAPPEHLRFHINSAVSTAGADRIGHGADPLWENNYSCLLRRMARNHIALESPPLSNKQILGLGPQTHPLRHYIRAGVPVALATDDEGVSRTDLTEQYVIAARDFRLGYRRLKTISTDSLRYSFLASSQKQAAQRRLNAAFRSFERRYSD